MATTPHDTPLLYAPADAARLLGISRASVYELMATGHLLSITIGRARRIHRSELERLARDGVA